VLRLNLCFRSPAAVFANVSETIEVVLPAVEMGILEYPGRKELLSGTGPRKSVEAPSCGNKFLRA
jgi:hypothetical protein